MNVQSVMDIFLICSTFFNTIKQSVTGSTVLDRVPLKTIETACNGIKFEIK
jgi:hypothetical protein